MDGAMIDPDGAVDVYGVGAGGKEAARGAGH